MAVMAACSDFLMALMGAEWESAADVLKLLALVGIAAGAAAWPGRSSAPRDLLGWKEPRSIYLLRFWNETMPGLRFLHFLRDGRDMAFSKNHNQLNCHGRAVLGDELEKARTATRSVALWNRVNLAAAEYGERHLGPRYLRVRVEDLCSDPRVTVESIFEFLGSRATSRRRRGEVRPPKSLGRWKKRRQKVIDELTETARPALGRFGYV
jgi:hypothetical protein